MPESMSAEATHLLVEARELGNRALAEADRLQSEREELDRQIKELRGIARRFGIAAAAPKARRSPSNHYGKGVNAAKVLAFAEAALAQDEMFTILGIHELIAPDASEGHTYAAARQLRDLGFIRKAGRDPGTKRELYAVMDADVIEPLRTQANG